MNFFPILGHVTRAAMYGLGVALAIVVGVLILEWIMQHRKPKQEYNSRKGEPIEK